jgi:hypothetical protein
MEFDDTKMGRAKNNKRKKKGGAGGRETPDTVNQRDAGALAPVGPLKDLPALDPQLLAKLHGDSKVVSSLDA